MMMSRWMAPALALVMAACGGQTVERTQIVDAAVAADVSAEASYLAYYTQPSTLPAGYTGTLSVMPLPSGKAIPLGEGAFAAGFGRSGDALLFLQEPTADASSPASTDGALSIWTPRLDAPVRLSSGYAPRSATALDRSTLLFHDTASADGKAPGQVKLLRTGECAGSSCPVTTVASDVALASLRVSSDGRYAAYEVQTLAGGTDTRDTWLVSVADGHPTHVATTVIPTQVKYSGAYESLFSPDGSLLATLTTNGNGPLQLQVISTATGQPVVWGAQPSGTLCLEATFADSQTVFAVLVDQGGKRSIYRTTATSASPFVDGTYFILSHSPPGAERYLFVTTTSGDELGAGAPFDLHLADLSAAGAGASLVPVAQSTHGSPAISDDLSTLWLLDRYDTSGTGTLMTAALPGGQLSTVATGVSYGFENFARGSSHLFYFTGVRGPLGAWINGASSVVDPDALRFATAASPPTMYVTTASPMAIYSEPLP